MDKLHLPYTAGRAEPQRGRRARGAQLLGRWLSNAGTRFVSISGISRRAQSTGRSGTFPLTPPTNPLSCSRILFPLLFIVIMIYVYYCYEVLFDE